jgi:1,2-diacylglycerol 3-beta-galactosyltransferase
MYKYRATSLLGGDADRKAGEKQQVEILILTASTGAGHNSVTTALQETLEEVAPSITVHVHDVLASTKPCLPNWYDATVEYAPWLWRLFYRTTDHEWAVRLGTATVRPWEHQLRASLEAMQPDLVISVHPICTQLAAGILRSAHHRAPLHCVVTDLATVHQSWASEQVRQYYVATSEAGAALTARGIDPHRIRVTGLPLRAAFGSFDSEPPMDSRPRVLLLGGGRPSRRLEAVARELAAPGLSHDLTVVCGRNRSLQRRLARDLGSRATVLGWRNDIAALMRASSVVVTKAGPTTVAEALSQARPLVIYQALEDQETGNVALATRCGSASYSPDVDAIAQSVALARQSRRARDSAGAAWWGRAGRRTAEQIAASLDRSPVRASHHPGTLSEDSQRPAHEIYNPISGERIVIQQNAAQTGGRLLSFDLFLPPGGHVPARHVHPSQEERFTVLEGQMHFRLGHRRRKIVAGPGETVLVPPGTVHWFGNPGREISLARVEARPALRLQEAFEHTAAMEVVQRFPGVRTPRVSDLAAFLIEYQRELAVPDVPAWTVRTFLAPLAWMGRRRARHTDRQAAA